MLALVESMPARYRALVVTGAGTGLRAPGELFGLTVDRVDFLRRTIRVDRQLVRVRGQGVVLGPLKTPASYRSVPLPQVVADALAAHLASRWPASDLGLIFTNERSDPVQQHPFAEVWGTAKPKADLPEWATPNDLRHYFASVLIRSGASVKVIQARLGHSSAKTTLDVYGTCSATRRTGPERRSMLSSDPNVHQVHQDRVAVDSGPGQGTISAYTS